MERKDLHGYFTRCHQTWLDFIQVTDVFTPLHSPSVKTWIYSLTIHTYGRGVRKSLISSSCRTSCDSPIGELDGRTPKGRGKRSRVPLSDTFKDINERKLRKEMRRQSGESSMGLSWPFLCVASSLLWWRYWAGYLFLHLSWIGMGHHKRVSFTSK